MCENRKRGRAIAAASWNLFRTESFYEYRKGAALECVVSVIGGLVHRLVGWFIGWFIGWSWLVGLGWSVGGCFFFFSFSFNFYLLLFS